MIAYLIKMMLCSGLLLLFYFLLLEREKMHRFNRCYLLFSLLFSLAIPLVEMQGEQELILFTEPVYISDEPLALIDTNTETAVRQEPQASNQHTAWIFVYGAVTAILLLRFSSNLFILRKKIRRSPALPYHKVQLVLTNEDTLPYNFFRYIFVNKSDYLQGRIETEILHHEEAHAVQKHSLDVLLVELLLALAWFNPFFYAYKRAIRLNHEFLADDAVVKKCSEVKAYQYLLVNKMAGTPTGRLSSSFNYLIPKKRLVMMTKKTSPFVATTKMFQTLIVLVAVSFLFSSKITAQETNRPEKSKGEKENVLPDTVRPKPTVGVSIGSTKEGVANDLLNEYQRITERYMESGTGQGSKLWNMPQADRSRLEIIFKQMNPEQQNKQRLAFMKTPKPLPKVVPTRTQWEKFKNASVYGVWIDNKKVANETLNNYTNTDFSQVFISKLYGGAKKGRRYTHQLDLMTNEFYEKYVSEALQKQQSSMVLRAPDKTRIRQE